MSRYSMTDGRYELGDNSGVICHASKKRDAFDCMARKYKRGLLDGDGYIFDRMAMIGAIELWEVTANGIDPVREKVQPRY